MSKRGSCGKSARYTHPIRLRNGPYCPENSNSRIPPQGISLHYNTWTVLEKLGVPYIPSESFFRNSDLLRNGLWNGRTGAVLKTSYDSRICAPVLFQVLYVLTFNQPASQSTSDMCEHNAPGCNRLC